MPDYSRKLDAIQVQMIRRMYWFGGMKQCVIAKEYKISPSQVSQIIRRKSWPFLPRVINEYI